MMWSTAPISLFAEPSPSRVMPSSFVISVLAHTASVGVLSYGLIHFPEINEYSLTERYSVRHLELRENDPPAGATHETSIGYPGPVIGSAADKSNPADTALQNIPEAVPGPQTLVQPGFHLHHALQKEAPLPNIVIWTPELRTVKTIVPPRPDQPTSSAVHPSIEPPNEELNPSDYGISATNTPSRDQPIPTGTTSPLAVPAPELVQLPPATISESTETPTPAAVLSLSDMHMTDGSVTLPPINETRSTSASKAAVLGLAGKLPAKSTAGQPGGASAKHQDPVAGTPGAVANAKAGNGPKPSPGTSQRVDQDTGADDHAAAEHISLPPNGRFGVVVVGTSLAEEYPEAAAIWSNRVAYTAYVHVGLNKNWILQYAVLRSVESANAGSVARLEAPWPYDIFRPNLISRDLNAEALMVHGVLSEGGRLESLSVAFPAQFAHASFVLRALERWQFRPARQNGKATAVEILMIIPDELD